MATEKDRIEHLEQMVDGLQKAVIQLKAREIERRNSELAQIEQAQQWLAFLRSLHQRGGAFRFDA